MDQSIQNYGIIEDLTVWMYLGFSGLVTHTTNQTNDLITCMTALKFLHILSTCST